MLHLDFWGRAFQLSVPQVVALGTLLYAGLVFGLYKVVEYFFGDEQAEWVYRTIGLPLGFLVYVINRVWWAIRWPWRYRNRRLLKEIFGIDTDDKTNWLFLIGASQGRVDQKLAQRAGSLHFWFDAEVKARKGNKEQLRIVKEVVRWHKKEFWFAHGLAKKNGFSVKPKVDDYHQPFIDWVDPHYLPA